MKENSSINSFKNKIKVISQFPELVVNVALVILLTFFFF
jgi:hypothetical protein